MPTAQPRLVLHLLPPSHPCHAVEAALALKGLEFERVELSIGRHGEEMARIYGEGRTTVPGLLVDDEPVHGSNAILERLEALAPEPPLYPAGIAERVAEAARWGDEELQDLGRRIPWGALHFRPEMLSVVGGAAEPLDPAGVDYAMRFVRAAWKYHGITAARLAEDLAGLPAKLDVCDGFVAEGLMGGDAPTAADLQIGATLRVLMFVADVRPLVEGRPCAASAARFFPPLPAGAIPAGAFPAGWVPSAG
ncbi:MAG TPA: glutathione S-transferase family protein [Capillimicrobium sp.]|nr:glutathione S-transferase family protein [Capillimicrobium sp.]